MQRGSNIAVKHLDSLPDAGVEVYSAMTREAQEGACHDVGELRA